MTVSSTTSKAIYSGNGSTTAFAVPFYFLAAADLEVILRSGTTETVQALTTNYTVSGAGSEAGGTVTMLVAPASGTTLTIRRSIAATQGTDLLPNDRLPAEDLEDGLDKLTMIAQQLGEESGRSIKFPASDAAASATLPVASARASKFLTFDSNGLPVATVGVDATTDIFTQTGTGATPRSVNDKLRDTVSVKDFGAVGDGATNDTLAIQTAINTGKSVVFPQGSYLANNLTASTDFQRLVADGDVKIIKNANGPILTVTGSDVEINGVSFRGDATTPTFTGDNVVASGSHFRMINCGSRWAAGRAVKATGGHVQIIGTCDIYQTADATATGYDIEIGVSGTATLYHELIGIYSSQSTGGIKLIDTGSHTISGGQFGKLYIASGTSPAGVNGGKTMGARILGNVTVELSSSVFAGNQFAAVTITFAAGTSAHHLDDSNFFASATVVNSGTNNSPIVKSIGTGSPGGIRLQYGADAANVVVRYAQNELYAEGSNLNLDNNKAVRIANTSGTYLNGLSLSGSNHWSVGNGDGAGFTNVLSGSGGVYAAVSSTTIAQFYSGGLRPQADDTFSLGTNSQRWSVVYAATPIISTSDARVKQQVRPLMDAERAVAVRLKGLVRAFKFNDAVKEKGDGARIHFGVIAQDVVEAFASEGLRANDYGLLCHDSWQETPEIRDDNGNVIQSRIPAGDRYGIRYEELLAFVLAAI